MIGSALPARVECRQVLGAARGAHGPTGGCQRALSGPCCVSSSDHPISQRTAGSDRKRYRIVRSSQREVVGHNGQH